VDVSRLLRVFHDRKQWAGPAAGVDGLTWDDIGGSEAADVFRTVSRAALAGEYVPHPERRRDIPRPGRSPRPLDIGTVVNRTVAASLAGLMAPALDLFLGPYSFAYRRKRSYLDMLAMLATIARGEGRWVVGNHDVSAAFPSVPFEGVMDAHRQLFAAPQLQRGKGRNARARRRQEDERLLQFIDVVLRGADRRERGLSQGNPYSPSAMELFMYSVLDAHALQDPSSPPRLRYSDNIAPLCRSVSEGQLDRDRCQELLRPHGLRLKEPTDPEEKVIADLNAGEGTRILGFTIGKRNGFMTLDIGQTSWDHLETSLKECHLMPNPPRTAQSVITGWVTAMGPAFEKWRRDDITQRALETARRTGFRETNPEEVQRQWKNAWCSWEQSLTRAGNAHQKMVEANGVTAAAAAPRARVQAEPA
jgi:hypothetical protein